jgi:hypothetical protein
MAKFRVVCSTVSTYSVVVDAPSKEVVEHWYDENYIRKLKSDISDIPDIRENIKHIKTIILMPPDSIQIIIYSLLKGMFMSLKDKYKDMYNKDDIIDIILKNNNINEKKYLNSLSNFSNIIKNILLFNNKINKKNTVDYMLFKTSKNKKDKEKILDDMIKELENVGNFNKLCEDGSRCDIINKIKKSLINQDQYSLTKFELQYRDSQYKDLNE